MTVHTDDFNRSNGAIGSNWTSTGDTASKAEIASNRLRLVAGGDPTFVYTGGTALGANQSCEAKTYPLASGSGIIVTVRASNSDCSAYGADLGYAGELALITLDADGNTDALLADFGTVSVVSGAVLKLKAVGSTLTVYYNGTEYGPVTDSTRASGYAGFQLYGSGNSVEIDDFSATDELATVAPTVTTTSLPGAVVGVAYSQTLTATGDATITWSVQSGSLPNGLSLNASTGAITGTPTTSGSSTFTVRATNGAGFDDQSLTIVVSEAPTITVTPDPTTATVGGTRTETITRSVAAGAGGVTYNLTSSNASVATVPANTTMAEAATTKTFDITGVSVGTANITATNAADSGETDTISITVSAPTTTTLKLLAHIDALGATAVKGAVFQPGTGGNLLGAKIGDFTGEAFESVAESGQAPLLVPVTSFGGGSLTVSDTPVCVWEATSAAGSALGSGVTIGSVGPHECTVVEV